MELYTMNGVVLPDLANKPLSEFKTLRELSLALDALEMQDREKCNCWRVMPGQHSQCIANRHFSPKW